MARHRKAYDSPSSAPKVDTEAAAERVLDHFLAERDDQVAAEVAKLDPLTAAAVAIRVCYQLDAPETAEFLETLEDFECVH